MHNIASTLSIAQVLNPQTITASALSSGNIDMQGAETLAVVLLVGNISEALDGSHKIDVKIEHADDDGTGSPAAYGACTDSDVLNASGLVSGVFLTVDSNTEEQKRHVVEYIGGKRFVKVTATPTGLSTGGPVAMLALKGNLTQRPVSNS